MLEENAVVVELLVRRGGGHGNVDGNPEQSLKKEVKSIA